MALSAKAHRSPAEVGKFGKTTFPTVPREKKGLPTRNYDSRRASAGEPCAGVVRSERSPFLGR